MTTSAQDSKELHLLGGTNLLADPLRIDDNENAKAKNLYPTIDRKLAKRNTAGYFSAIHTGYDTGGGSFDWLSQENMLPLNLIIPAITGVDFVHTFYDSVTGKAYFGWGEFSPDPLEGRKVQTFEIPFVRGFRPKLLHFRGVEDWIIALPGALNPALTPPAPFSCVGMLETGLYGAQGGSFLGTTNDDIPAPKVIGTYRSRAVWANFGPSNKNVFFLSDTNNPFQIPDSAIASAFSFRLGAMQGDEIVAVAEITQSVVGTASNSALLILGRKTAFIMTGEPEESDFVPALGDPDSAYIADVVISQIQQRCGCASAETLVRTPYGLIWASDDDVWKFDYGSMPVRIGSKIRPALAVSNPPKRWCWHAEYSAKDGSYRLAIIGEGQVTSADVLPCQDQWWLDLRDGMPQGSADARWWGPQRYVMQELADVAPDHAGTFIMASDRRAGHDEALYAEHVGNHPLYEEDASKTRLAIVDLNAAEGWDNARPENYIDPYYPANDPVVVPKSEYLDNEVSIELHTKRFDLEDRYTDKLALGVEVSMWANDLCTLRCETVCGGGVMVDDQTVVADQTGLALDADSEGTRETHEYQSVLIPPSSSDRYMGNTLQYKLYDVPGYPVSGSNSWISFKNAASAILKTAVVPDGLYASLTTFLAALSTAASPYTVESTGSPISLALKFFSSPMEYYMEFGDRTARKIGAMLGFDTSVNAMPATAQVAETAVPPKISTALELAGIIFKWYPFGRGPT